MENIKLEDLKNKKFHFIGIGGISMSALAMVLHKKGFMVQGSDLVKNHEALRLERAGVKIFEGHLQKNVSDCEVVVYSSAVKDDNIEFKFAKQNELILLKRAELLAMIAAEHETVIAVAGSHGKTTTTAMLAEVFVKAGCCPSYQVGGVLKSSNSNFKIGAKDYFIVEACEYQDNYLFLKPDIAVVLNVDSDHLDYFKSLDGVKKSFQNFAGLVKEKENLFVCADDKNSAEMIDCSTTFGVNRQAEFMAINIKEYKPCYFEFDVLQKKVKLGKIRLNILGRHNVFNALAVIAISVSCGIRFDKIKFAIENFKGVKRRTEFISKVCGAEIYHDYAHHPKQIEKMIMVGRKLVKRVKGKVIVVFEPHTFSRTRFLIKEFVDALSKADYVILAPVYSARELPEEGYDSLKLSNDIKEKLNNVEYLESYAEIKKRVEEVSCENDVVMILGAGSIEHLAKMWK